MGILNAMKNSYNKAKEERLETERYFINKELVVKQRSANAVYIVAMNKYKTSHVLHLLLSIITVGFWIPVWLLVSISNANARRSAAKTLDRHLTLDV